MSNTINPLISNYDSNNSQNNNIDQNQSAMNLILDEPDISIGNTTSLPQQSQQVTIPPILLRTDPPKNKKTYWRFPRSIFSFTNRKRDKRSISRSVKKMNRSIKALDDLPTELLHIILAFYTNSYRGLLLFSTISKTCKEVSDFSLLWLTCELKFYAPKGYLVALDVMPTSYVGTAEDYLKANSLTLYSPMYTYQLFEGMKVYPPVYIVEITRPSPATQHHRHLSFQIPSDDSSIMMDLVLNGLHSINGVGSIDVNNHDNNNQNNQHHNPRNPTELKYMYANRIKLEFLEYFQEYQRLWNWHAHYRKYLEYYYEIFHLIGKEFQYVLILSMILLSLSVYFLSDLQFFSLSNDNYIGFALIFTNLTLFYALIVGVIPYSCIDYWIHNYDTLAPKWDYTQCLSGINSGFLLGTGVYIPTVLTYLRILYPNSEVIQSIPWWSIVLIMWGFFLLSISLWIREVFQVYDKWDLAILIFMLYVINAIPATCMFLVLYYDDEGSSIKHHGILDLGDILIPLYPLFFLALGFTCYRIVSMLMLWKSWIWNRHPLGYGFSTQFRSDFMFLLANFSLNMFAIINSFSIIGLSILTFETNDNQHDQGNEMWDKDSIGIHFSAIVFILLFFISFQGIFLCFVFEDSISY